MNSLYVKVAAYPLLAVLFLCGLFVAPPTVSAEISYSIGGYLGSDPCGSAATQPCVDRADDYSDAKIYVRITYSGTGTNTYNQVRLYKSTQNPFPLDAAHLAETKIVSLNHPASPHDVPSFELDNLSNINYYWKVTVNGVSGNIVAETPVYTLTAAPPLKYHIGGNCGNNQPCRTLSPTTANPTSLELATTITTTGGTPDQKDDHYPNVYFFVDEHNPPTTQVASWTNIGFKKHSVPIEVSLTKDTLHGGSLEPSKTYYYQIMIGNGSVEGSLSPVWTFTTGAAQPPTVLLGSLGGGANANGGGNGGGANANGGGNGGGAAVAGQTNTLNGIVTFIPNPLKAKSIVGFIKDAVDLAIQIAIPIIALAIIRGGYLFISARGNTEKIESAKTTFLYTLLGGGVLVGAWALAEIISETISAISA
jgi:hypothetical protein